MSQLNQSMQSVLALQQRLQGVEANINSISSGPTTPQTTEKINELNGIKQTLQRQIQAAKQTTLAANQQQQSMVYHTITPSNMTHLTGSSPMVNITSTYNPTTLQTMHQQPQVSVMVKDDKKVLSKQRLQELVKEIDVNEQLDDDVEELLMTITDDFIESTINAACNLAKHRNSNTLEIKDLKLHLEKEWNITVPGFGSDELRPYKKTFSTEAHKQRLALIRKATKK